MWMMPYILTFGTACFFYSRDHESAHDAILSTLHSTEQNSIVPYCDDDMDDFMADTLL